MNATEATEFPAFVQARFKGVLTQGAHSPDGAACLHEALNVAQGREWSDDPHGMPDLRPLNDAPWSSDQARTDALLPVAVALWDFEDWPDERKRAWARRVASETIRRVLPIALRAAADAHPEHRDALTKAAEACVKDGSAESAVAAWSAARSASAAAWSAAAAAESAVSAESAAWSAAESAWSAAARSASAAAWSAAESAESARETPLRLMATLLVEAAEATK